MQKLKTNPEWVEKLSDIIELNKKKEKKKSSPSEPNEQTNTN